MSTDEVSSGDIRIALFCCKCGLLCGSTTELVVLHLKELRRVGWSDDTICESCASGVEE